MGPEIKASCHCGAVRLSARLSEPLEAARRCDCTFCRRRAAAMISARVEDVVVETGADKLTLYSFGTHTAKHFFCSVCGIYTHHQRRSNPGEMGINVGCIEGLPPRWAERAIWTDGVHHPCDSRE